MPKTRLIVRDGRLREDEQGPLGIYLCEECNTLNAGYGVCPYCTKAADCVVVRSIEGHMLTMARPLAASLGVAPVPLGACLCCNEPPSDPHWSRICLDEGDASKPRIFSERGDGHAHSH